MKTSFYTGNDKVVDQEPDRDNSLSKSQDKIFHLTSPHTAGGRRQEGPRHAHGPRQGARRRALVHLELRWRGRQQRVSRAVVGRGRALGAEVHELVSGLLLHGRGDGYLYASLIR